MALPLLSLGVPVDIVPLEAATNEAYLERFKVLLVSYDTGKPSKQEYHAALLRWVRRGGVLLVLGGMNAYNDLPDWWRERGAGSPTACLLRDVGLVDEGGEILPQKPGGIAYSGSGPMADLLRGLYDGLHGATSCPARSQLFPTAAGPRRTISGRQSSRGESASPSAWTGDRCAISVFATGPATSLTGST